MSILKENAKAIMELTINIILTYLIPIVNVIILISNKEAYQDATDITIAICSVFASTAAAAACTIKGIRNDSSKIIGTIQPFALVLSMVAFFACLVYDVGGTLYLAAGILVSMTIISNIVAICMYVISDREIKSLIDEFDNKKKMKAKAKKSSVKNTRNINLEPKEGE